MELRLLPGWICGDPLIFSRIDLAFIRARLWNKMEIWEEHCWIFQITWSKKSSWTSKNSYCVYDTNKCAISTGNIPHTYFIRQGQTLPQTSLLLLEDLKISHCYLKKITKCWLDFVKVKHENEIKISVILCLWGQNEARSLEEAYRFEETEAFKGFTI